MLKACIINHGRELSKTAGSLYDNGIEDIIVISNRLRHYNGAIHGCATEATARNQYLKRLKDGDWFLSIDSDEILTTTVDNRMLKGDTALVKMELADGDFCLAPRLIHYRKGMRYITHYLLGKDSTYQNLSFVTTTFNNKKHDLPYAATIKHLRQGHSEEEKIWKEYQRKREKRVEKKVKSKGGVICGYI